MGFRSMVMSSDFTHVSESFKEKYKDSLEFGNYWMTSKGEWKTYGVWDKLETDVQAAIDWGKRTSPVRLTFVHECDGITVCSVAEDKITWVEPSDWKITEGVTHNYCYGCTEFD